MEYYEQAIAEARENEYINVEALGNRLAAKFYLSIGQKRIARIYMKEARSCFVRWGAHAVVKHLDETYVDLLTDSDAEQGKKAADNDFSSEQIASVKDTSTISTYSSGGHSTQVLDLTTVMKASQTISGEIQLEALLEKMMKIVIENAGAQSGAILLENKGIWNTEAQSGIRDQDSGIRDRGLSNSQSLTPDPDPLTPESIIQYVIRTSETVILNNALEEGRFSSDPYIVNQQPKSVLCLPIMSRGKLIGILYLENNLTAGAFTPDRLEVLRLLSSQVAISIENARIYGNLEHLVKERTSDLSQALENLKSTQNQLVESEKNGFPGWTGGRCSP